MIAYMLKSGHMDAGIETVVLALPFCQQNKKTLN